MCIQIHIYTYIHTYIVKSAVKKSRKYSGERSLKKLVPSTAYTDEMISRMKKALHTGEIEAAVAERIFWRFLRDLKMRTTRPSRRRRRSLAFGSSTLACVRRMLPTLRATMCGNVLLY